MIEDTHTLPTESSTPLVSRSGYVGVFSTTMNLLNSVLGAGILSISNSFTFCGLIPSVSIITISGVLSYASAALIVKMQLQTNCDSISTLAGMALGNFGKIIMGISCAFFCYSCMTAYIIMGTEIIQSYAMLMGFDLHPFGKRAVLVLIFAFVGPIALTLPRKLTFLGYISFSCFASLFIFSGGMIYEGAIKLSHDGIDPSVETGVFNLGIFNALGIYSLSFALAAVIVPIIKHMTPNLQKRYLASGCAFFFSFLMVLVPGVIGYLMFGRSAQPLILNNFPDDDVLFIIVRAGCFIILISSYPVLGLTILGLISRIIYGTEDQQRLPWQRRAICLVLENALPLLIAVFLPNVRPAMAIGGALGGGISNFVLPALIWFVLSPRKWYYWTNLLCIAFVFFGVCASAIATYESVLDAIHEFSK